MKVTRSHRAISFYGALSLITGEEIPHICAWQNSEETIKFLEIIKKHYTGKGVVLLIWDNASWHKSQIIKDWLRQNPGCIELMNFPVYSPNLNPQEHVWKLLKAELSHYIHEYSWKEIKDHACFFLNTHIFNYSL